MQRKVLAALLLAVVMITAGCTGPGADGTPTGEEADEPLEEETPTDEGALDEESEDESEDMNETATPGMNESDMDESEDMNGSEDMNESDTNESY